jgi:hypothetical protein
MVPVPPGDRFTEVTPGVVARHDQDGIVFVIVTDGIAALPRGRRTGWEVTALPHPNGHHPADARRPR